MTLLRLTVLFSALQLQTKAPYAKRRRVLIFTRNRLEETY